MKPLYKILCRAYQFCFHAALPLLPYREPKKLKSTDDIIEILKRQGIKSVLLVTDEFLVKSEKCTALKKSITDNNIHLEIYNKTLPNTTVNNVNDAKKLYIHGTCQALIAYGGCSSMDCAKAVGKVVLHRDAENLTPVVLELGGKSPCIVDSTAKIELAAKRIVFGKYLNCGQTCVTPDYILCHKSIKDKFVEEVCKEIKLQYGDKPIKNIDYGKIINEKHFNRIMGLIDKEKIVCGGDYDADFGGFGESGMGNYHGKIGFDAFSHNKSIVDKKPGLIYR